MTWCLVCTFIIEAGLFWNLLWNSARWLYLKDKNDVFFASFLHPSGGLMAFACVSRWCRKCSRIYRTVAFSFPLDGPPVTDPATTRRSKKYSFAFYELLDIFGFKIDENFRNWYSIHIWTILLLIKLAFWNRKF